MKTPFARLGALAFAATLALTAQAFAHAHLKTIVPADKATVATAPKQLVLNFTEELNLKFSGIELTGPKNEKIKTGTESLSQDKKTLTVPLEGTLAPGAYMVDWHALSEDGHKTHGMTSFTVKP
ncbi:copper homeostasis periplasmic binding protein CopC [Allorhizobium sp. BGMRC 0089]|uniref:copper homeostasis periplasmic binding protein CopC n=1 Tax=Allorhizobium sonneratiae TaxID=2934936 RepID=UPI002033F0AC|nr:copper homeostasis periplasmic binding protein CopC [Allorhizobium sonneratiae]MCM2293350.1 copper homeostasis periplasmic binding protein CopC [Allorhizobium sonneratiae]